MDKYYPFHMRVAGSTPELKTRLLEDDKIIAFFDSNYIICEEQITSAMYRASRSFNQGKAIAKHFNIELMLHLVGTHQIKIALSLFDITENTSEIVVISKNPALDISNLEKGFPSFKDDIDKLDRLRIKDTQNPCRAIVSQGARLVTDHE